MVRFRFDQRVPTRDGVELSVDVYLPDHTSGPVPAILQRTPYDNANPDVIASARYFADHGYAFVAADVRGRGDSDGRFTPFRGEGPDGYDTVEWIAAQDWCDGQVAMMGGSYAASVQWWAARERPPHLVTMVNTATSGLWAQDPQRTGKLRPSLFLWLHAVAGHTMQPPLSPEELRRVLTHRPYREVDAALGRTNTAWRDWMAHAEDPGWWDAESPFHGFDRIDLPVLHISGWYDGSIGGQLESYQRMRAESPAADRQWLLVGPWDHAGTRKPQQLLRGTLDFGGSAVLDIPGVHLRWFDHWLRGVDNGVAGDPRVRVFTIGDNVWRDLPEWPPPTTPQHWFLHADGSIATEEPLGGGRRYAYDPLDPTPSAPDDEPLAWGGAPLDRLDHGFVESRPDVVVYTSDPLVDAVAVDGAPEVVLWATTDAVDTDFAAVVCDVHPDGRSIAVAEGLIRTSFLDPESEPGVPRQYRIRLNATSLVFQPGHRIRVTVSSAEFPAYNRNPNTGAAFGEDRDTVVAHQYIHHSPGMASCLVLPIGPASPA